MAAALLVTEVVQVTLIVRREAEAENVESELRCANAMLEELMSERDRQTGEIKRVMRAIDDLMETQERIQAEQARRTPFIRSLRDGSAD